jgi:hypothetical protein
MMMISLLLLGLSVATLTYGSETDSTYLDGEHVLLWLNKIGKDVFFFQFFFGFRKGHRERDVRWFVFGLLVCVCVCRKRDVYLFVVF